MNWVVRPARHPNESSSGYECRLAEANGFTSIRTWRLAKTFPVRCEAASSTDDQMASDGGDIPWGSRFLLMQHLRVCPLCLSGSSYLKMSWDHALLPTCHIHHVGLVDRCNLCKKLLMRGPGRVTHCECGQQLSGLPCHKAEPSAVERLLESRLNVARDVVCSDLSGDFRALSTKGLLKVVMLFGAYIAYENTRKPRKLPLKANIEIPRRILESASTVFADWPQNFHRMLSEIYRGKMMRGGIQRVFGYFYEALYDELVEDEFQFLRDAFERWVHLEWQAPLTHRHRRLQKVGSRPKTLPVSTVSRATGVSRGDLVGWVLRGELRGSVRNLPSGRRAVLIEASQEAQIAKLSRRLDLQEASRVLRLPENRLRELLEAGFLHGEKPSARGRWKIHASEITRLLRKVMALPIATESDTGLWPLATVLRTKIASGDSFAALIQAIFDGQVVCRRTSSRCRKSFSGLLLSKESLTSWQRQTASGLSIPEFAEQLGIKQEVAYHLVRRRIIQASDHGRKGSYVSLTELEGFKALYVWSRDVARAQGTSPKSLTEKLKSAGVVPVVGPSIDGCRQYLYRRTDIETYLGLNSLEQKPNI